MLLFRQRKTLRKLWQEYSNHNLRIRAKRTRENYRRSIRRLAEIVGREPTINDLTDENLAQVVRLMLDLGRAAPTANNYAKCLIALWRFANIRGYMRTRPCVAKLPEPDPETSTWSPRELASLWKACSLQPGYVGPVRAADWWLTLHHVAYDTAERTSTLLAIEEAWIDRDEATLRIPPGARKGKKKRAHYRLRPATVSKIDAIWYPERRLLFEGMEWRSFHRAYQAILVCAGLPTGRRNGLQRIRRTVATLLEAAGGDATAFLQHSDRRVTQRSYLDDARIDTKGPVDLLPPVQW